MGVFGFGSPGTYLLALGPDASSRGRGAEEGGGGGGITFGTVGVALASTRLE